MKQTLLITILGITACLQGCFSPGSGFPEKHFYSFDDIELPQAARSPALPLFARPFDISVEWDTVSFVYRIGQHEYKTLYAAEFMKSPASLVREKTVSALYGTGLFTPVSQIFDKTHRHRLAGRINHLYADIRNKEEPMAVLDINLALSDGSRILWEKSYQCRRQARSPAPADMMPAWSHALDRIVHDFYNDILKISHPDGY